NGAATDYGLWFDIATADRAVIEKLGSHTFNDLPDEIGELHLRSPFDWAEFVQEAVIPGWGNQEEIDDSLGLSLLCFLERWIKPYFAETYYDQLLERLTAANHLGIETELLEPT